MPQVFVCCSRSTGQVMHRETFDLCSWHALNRDTTSLFYPGHAASWADVMQCSHLQRFVDRTGTRFFANSRDPPAGSGCHIELCMARNLIHKRQPAHAVIARSQRSARQSSWNPKPQHLLSLPWVAGPSESASASVARGEELPLATRIQSRPIGL